MGLFGKKKADYDWFHEGNQFFDVGEYLKAIDCYHEVSDKSVRLMLDAQRNTALCLVNLKRYQTALDMLNFVLKIDPDEYQSLTYRTKLLEKMDKPDEFNASYIQLMAYRQKEFPNEDPEEWYRSNPYLNS